MQVGAFERYIPLRIKTKTVYIHKCTDNRCGIVPMDSKVLGFDNNNIIFLIQHKTREIGLIDFEVTTNHSLSFLLKLNLRIQLS